MSDRKIIYADDAIDAITNYGKFLWDNFHETCNLAGMIDAIEALPTIDPVKHGRWIGYPEVLQFTDALNEEYIGCPVCKNVWNIMDNDADRFNYCPNCGARMEGGTNHDKHGRAV